MPNNKLILRSVNSPWVTPFNDITKNNVLGWSDVDNNFIYLKGELIHSGYTNNNTLFLQKINGNTISVNLNITPSGTDVYVTGGTYSNGTLELLNNTGGTFNVNGFYTGYTLTTQEIENVLGYLPLSAYTDTFLTGATFDTISGVATFTNNSGGTFTLSGLASNDVFLTGGTYNPTTGTATFTNNSGGTFNVDGFLTGYTNYYTTGATLNDTILSFDRTDSLSAYTVDLSSLTSYGNQWFVPSGTTVEVKENYQSFIYGDLYIQGTLLLNDNAQLVVLNGDIILSGGSISGNGTTLLVELPEFDTKVTGGTYSNGNLILTDNFGADITVNGFYTGSTDTYVTGGTYFSGGTIVFNYNTGGDFEVSGLTIDLDTEIAGLAEADEQTITLNLDTNKIELKEIITEATGGTRTFQGDFAISGGTLNLDTIGSGSPVINLGLDSNGFVVTGTTSTPFTGNTSGDCISDLYISNLYGCSPVTIHDSIQSVGSIASGNTSFAFGFQTTASGDYSHAEGQSTIASGESAHAEGINTTAFGSASHAEGFGSIAFGDYSYAGGNGTTAIGDYSYAGGIKSIASGVTSFVYSDSSIVIGNRSVVLGGQNITGTTDDTVYVPNLTIQSGNVINSSAGGGQINLNDSYGSDGTWSITSDGGSYGLGSAWVYGQPNNGNQLAYQISNIEAIGFGVYEGGVNPLLNAAKEVTISNNTTLNGFSGDSDKKAVFIGTKNSTINANIINTVIIGGQDITGATNNTVYVPDLVIKKSAAVPTSSADIVGEDGSITWDNTHFYWKANGQWLRVSGSTF